MPADDAAQKQLEVEEMSAELRRAEAAAVYGLPEEDLGACYATRTLPKRKVLPGQVANRVTAIASDEFSLTLACSSRLMPAASHPGGRSR